MAPVSYVPGEVWARGGRGDETTNGALSGDDREKIEVDLLLAGIRKRYGYDFTHYSHASLMRRLKRGCEQASVTRFTELLDRLLHDESSFDDFLKHMSVSGRPHGNLCRQLSGGGRYGRPVRLLRRRLRSGEIQGLPERAHHLFLS